MIKKEHWETVFSTKTEKEVSWYQQYPKTSVDYVAALHLPLDAKIIDIGGGDSYLMDALLDLGYTNLTLLDISDKAIERIKARLGEKADQVTFIVSDVLDFNPKDAYDFWHDRACFHFLTQPEQISQYVAIVNKVLADDGKLFIGTFSESGPQKCSGLPISQYTEERFKEVFGEHFRLTDTLEQDHQTPFDTIQHFIFCGFKRI